MYKEIKKCRICGNDELVSILNLGNQYLTGVFPSAKKERLTSGPLELVKCRDDNNESSCGLVQLKHSYSHYEMYGNNYGYRSNLNKSMVNHLCEKVKKIKNSFNLKRGDLIIDIGSNDSTLLQGYGNDGLVLVGVDPTGKKFKKYYPEHIHLIPDYFSIKSVEKVFCSKKAKVITSIAMFYDLESPIAFAEQIKELLADDGVWIFEQSYMPAMLETNAYDTVCHEHLEYYSLKQIKWLTDSLNLKIIDIEFNAVNGGSFSISVSKQNSPYKENTSLVQKILSEENNKQLNSLRPYAAFKQRVQKHKEKLLAFIKQINKNSKKIFGYGASTKGNVILQYCNITKKDIPCIAEVNSDKFGCFTPGTHIPIVSEEEAKKLKPDYFLVLPWHFRSAIIEKERDYLNSGGKMVFILPSLEVT